MDHPAGVDRFDEAQSGSEPTLRQFEPLVVVTTTREPADGTELVDKSAERRARRRSLRSRRFACSLLERERADCGNWELVPRFDRTARPINM